MRNVIIALAAAGILAAALPSPVHANCNGCGVAAGVVGGLAAGAIVGSAIANSRPVYVEPAPVYVAPPSVYAVPPRMTARSVMWNVSRYGTATPTGQDASRSAIDATQRRMCSSTAAVGQQSTLSPFFF
jgi:hypothetical protein